MDAAPPPSGTEPAFHRHVLVDPGDRIVTASVEDDYHHMRVTLRHDRVTILGVEAEMIRAPWSTCPGAIAHLAATFVGTPLATAATQGDKPANCTHLFDMAVIAATRAADTAPTRYAIVVTDTVDGIRIARIARGGDPVMELVERAGVLASPAAVAGRSLFQLGPWIAGLDPALAEAARLLRWAAIIAHGRAIPLDRQSDARRMPPNCFTFQPPRKEQAVRTGRIVDFSTAVRRPLDA